MDEDNGNGFDPAAEATEDAFKGALYTIDGKTRADGILTRGDRQSMGVLQRAMTAIKEAIDYKQELKTANWTSLEVSSLAVRAIHQRLKCGVTIDPIVDDIIAKSAGVNSARLMAVIEGITSTYFHTNYNPNKQGLFTRGKNQNNGNNNNSILNQ